MSVEPISIQNIQIKKELLRDLKVVAAIDRGCSLLKVLFVTNSDYEAAKQQETITLTVELFPTKHLTSGIDSLLRQMYMPTDLSNVVLKVTGAGAERDMELLREKIPFKVVFVNEYDCQATGNLALIQHLAMDDLCYPLDEFTVESVLVNNEMIQRIKEQMEKTGYRKQFHAEDFPCLVAYLGSSGVFIKLHENGEFSPVGNVFLNGSALLGLAKLLLNTNNYEEIMELANKGERGNVDTQVFEIFSNTADSPYGQYKSDMPLFSFGKAVDYDKNLEDFSREDVAAALVAATATTLYNSIGGLVSKTKCTRVFLGGNMFLSPVFRRYFAEASKAFGAQDMFTIRLMKAGYAAAFGALLADVEKKE